MRLGYIYLIAKQKLQPILYSFLKIKDVRKSSVNLKLQGDFYNSFENEIGRSDIEFPDLDVWLEKECEIIGDGIVISNNSELVLESCLFQKEYVLKSGAIHKILLRKFYPYSHLDKVINLSNYLSNYYFHWNMEELLRLALLSDEDYKDKIVLVNEKSSSFVYSSLKFLFGISENQIMKCNRNKMIKAEECLMIPFQHVRPDLNLGKANLYYPSAIKRLSDRSKKVSVSGKRRNFLISRSQASQRKIINENLILEEFSDLDLELIELENLTFQDQVNLFFNAGLVIAAHGAGLTNLVYAGAPTVIELFPKNRLITDSLYFVQISKSLGFEHKLFMVESDGENQNIKVDKTLILELRQFVRDAIG